jgi:hypothetical protein
VIGEGAGSGEDGNDREGEGDGAEEGPGDDVPGATARWQALRKAPAPSTASAESIHSMKRRREMSLTARFPSPLPFTGPT